MTDDGEVNTEYFLYEIVIQVVIDDHGKKVIRCSAEDIHEEQVPLMEILGAIELSKDTFIRQTMGEVE